MISRKAKMKLNNTFYLFILIVMFLPTTLSCENFAKNQNSIGTTHHLQTEIDTSHWLEETRGIRSILEDRHGNLWFSSPDYVAKFDGRSMYYFSEDDGLNIVGNLHEDKNGTIWVEDGFKVFRYTDERFSEERLDSIINSDGLWIQRGLDPTDTTFVEPGIFEISKKTTAFHPLPIKQDINNKFLHLPTTKAVLGKDSTVWIGTMDSVYGFKNNSFTPIGRDEMGRQDDERQMGIRGIFIDSSGILWIADNGAGVFTYDGNEIINFTRKHHLDEGDAEGNTLHRAFSIAEDSEGKMWFGTVYSGIWSYNPATEEFNNYTSAEGVRSENIWTIYKTKEGEMLFAGESPAAVYVFNGKTFYRKY